MKRKRKIYSAPKPPDSFTKKQLKKAIIKVK